MAREILDHGRSRHGDDSEELHEDDIWGAGDDGDHDDAHDRSDDEDEGDARDQADARVAGQDGVEEEVDARSAEDRVPPLPRLTEVGSLRRPYGEGLLSGSLRGNGVHGVGLAGLGNSVSDGGGKGGGSGLKQVSGLDSSPSAPWMMKSPGELARKPKEGTFDWTQSAPVNVPSRSLTAAAAAGKNWRTMLEEDDDSRHGKKDFVPPHLITAMQVAQDTNGRAGTVYDAGSMVVGTYASNRKGAAQMRTRTAVLRNIGWDL